MKCPSQNASLEEDSEEDIKTTGGIKVTEKDNIKDNTVVFPVLTVIMAYVFLSLVAFIKATPGRGNNGVVSAAV